jgi:hypothetical protein
MRRFTRQFLFAVCPAFLTLLGGCVGYAPVETSTNPPVAIQLDPIVNRTDSSGIIAPLSRAVREEIAHSPFLELGSTDGPIIRLTLIERDRQSLARDPEDTGRPLSYEETLAMRIQIESADAHPLAELNGGILMADVQTYAALNFPEASSAASAELALILARKLRQQMEASLNRP